MMIRRTRVLCIGAAIGAAALMAACSQDPVTPDNNGPATNPGLGTATTTSPSAGPSGGVTTTTASNSQEDAPAGQDGTITPNRPANPS